MPRLACMLVCCALLVVYSVFTPPLHAHPYAVVWARLHVKKDVAELQLTLLVEDFYYIYGLNADQGLELSEADIVASIEKHKAYLPQRMTLMTADGAKLTPRITGVVRRTPDHRPANATMSEMVVFTLAYDFKKPPDGLTFTHTYADEKMQMAVVELAVTQHGHPPGPRKVVDRGGYEMYAFDWDAPPPDGPAPQPDDAERERQDRYGITSYGALYSYLYVTDREVRHELLVPLATMDKWQYVERRRPSVLTVKEQAAAREGIYTFFADKHPLRIDGVVVRPTLQRIDYYDLEFRDLALRPPSRNVPAYAARIAVILSYPVKGPPDEVSMRWDLFSRDVRALNTLLIAGDAVRKETLTPAAPELTWTRPDRAPRPAVDALPAPELPPPLRLPVASIALVFAGGVWMGVLCARKVPGRRIARTTLITVAAACVLWPLVTVDIARSPAPEEAMPPSEDAVRIFETLHRNMYRAFDYPSDEAVYDALARSADGPLLTELFLQIRAGLEMQEQGGAVAHVESVTLEDRVVEPLTVDNRAAPATDEDPRGFVVQATWTVMGTVEHWGHIHACTNRYRARFVVQARERAWKITALEVQDQEQVKIETRLREPE